MTGSDSAQEEWLTPKQAAALLGVSSRSVYSYIERGLLVSKGDRRSLQVSAASVDTMIARRSAERYVAESVQDSTAQEVKTGVAMQLARLEEEREVLMRKIQDLQELRRVDAEAVGELRGRLQGIERELERLERSHTSLQLANNRAWLLLALIVLLFVVALVIVVIVK